MTVNDNLQFDDEKHGIRENVKWHANLSKCPFLEYREGRLEVVFGGNFCQLDLDVFTKC
jgi:hypothetical protein